MSPPLLSCLLLSLRVRSGLIGFQCAPPSVDLNSTLPPKYTSLGSVAETAMGEVQLKRYLRSAGFINCTPCKYGRTEALSPVWLSSRSIDPFCESSYTMCDLPGAGTTYSPSPPTTVYHS